MYMIYNMNYIKVPLLMLTINRLEIWILIERNKQQKHDTKIKNDRFDMYNKNSNQNMIYRSSRSS